MATGKRSSAASGSRRRVPVGPALVPSMPRSREQQVAAGRALRAGCSRKTHAIWKAPTKRRGAVEMVLAAEEGRLPKLLPLRHGRMVRSPFTFYRASALTMATDLSSTPSTGVRIQICGDAHLSNFGGFATPERKVIFSINDLDETLPAVTEFSVAYADQNERDHAALAAAVKRGKVKAVFEEDR